MLIDLGKKNPGHPGLGDLEAFTQNLTVTGGTGDVVGAAGTMAFDGSGDTQTMTVHLH